MCASDWLGSCWYCNLEGKEHLRPVQQYAESYGVGRGTVQGAIQELKDCGAIALNACGARGTFLERVEQRKLFDACGYGELICLMPLNINMDYRGLATGIYEAISAKDLPIHILFARGSRNRVKMLLRQKCDFVAMSQLACEAAIERSGLTIEAAQTLGDYPADLGVITRRGMEYAPGRTKVAFDAYSYDQCAPARASGHAPGGAQGLPERATGGHGAPGHGGGGALRPLRRAGGWGIAISPAGNARGDARETAQGGGGPSATATSRCAICSRAR